jgi:hypothetical protein
LEDKAAQREEGGGVTKPIRYVIDKPDEYYVAGRSPNDPDDPGFSFVKVNAVPIRLKEIPDEDIFFHTSLDGFGCKISHGLTGLGFPGFHESKRAAITAAHDSIRIAKEPFTETVKKGMRLLKTWGLAEHSPRYRKEGGK